MTHKINITADDESLAWVREFTSYLISLNEIFPRPIEAIESLRNIDRTNAFHAETILAGRANEYRIVLRPCNTLIKLMLTFRTLDILG